MSSSTTIQEPLAVQLLRRRLLQQTSHRQQSISKKYHALSSSYNPTMTQTPPPPTEKNGPRGEMPDFEKEWKAFSEAFKSELESDLVWLEESYCLSPEDLPRKETGSGSQGGSSMVVEARVMERSVEGIQESQQGSGTRSEMQKDSEDIQDATKRNMEAVENDTWRVLAEWREREGISPWAEDR